MLLRSQGSDSYLLFLLSRGDKALRRDVAAEVVLHLSEEEVVLLEVLLADEGGLVGHDVGQEDPVVRREQHVVGLDVAVRESFAVQLEQPVEKLEHDPLLLGHIQLRDRV